MSHLIRLHGPWQVAFRLPSGGIQVTSELDNPLYSDRIKLPLANEAFGNLWEEANGSLPSSDAPLDFEVQFTRKFNWPHQDQTDPVYLIVESSHAFDQVILNGVSLPITEQCSGELNPHLKLTNELQLVGIGVVPTVLSIERVALRIG